MYDKEQQKKLLWYASKDLELAKGLSANFHHT